MDLAALASFVPHLVFWGLLGWALATDALCRGAVLAMAVGWLAVQFALGYVPVGAGLFPPLVAVFDIILVLVVFKGDVRLY